MTYEVMTISIDPMQLMGIVRRMLKEGKPAKVDFYTDAVREATGIPEITLTEVQRQQIKTLIYFHIYGGKGVPPIG